MRIISDIHGKIEKYIPIIRTCDESIQLGDFGFKNEWKWVYKNTDIISTRHKIVMGNHDYIPFVNSHPHSLGNWSFERGIFTVRGAYSIDRHKRTDGVDWFANEELNYIETNEVFDNWEKYRPDVVVTHDCPSMVSETFFGMPTTGINKQAFKSTTREMLQGLFEIHQPEIWIFGHHHQHKDSTINGTRFICLAELEYLDL